jgi:hypothetical protein
VVKLKVKFRFRFRFFRFYDFVAFPASDYTAELPSEQVS